MTDTTIAAFDDTIADGVRQDGQCQLEDVWHIQSGAM